MSKEADRRAEFQKNIGEPKESETPVIPELEKTEGEDPKDATETTTGSEDTGNEGEKDEELSFGTVEFFEEGTDVEKGKENVENPKSEPQKYKVDLKKLVDEHKDNLRSYFKYSDLDPESLSTEDLVRYKMSKENPTWSADDISEELKDIYGLGLKKKDIDYDVMEEDEIRKLEEYNNTIDSKLRRGERNLKSDALKAKELLQNDKGSLTLPEIELDIPTGSNNAQTVEAYVAEQQEKATEYLEKEWIPNVTKASTSVGGFKQSVKIQVAEGDEVVTELTYKFTDSQRQKLSEYMKTYRGQESDSKYVKEDTGEVDYKGLVNQRAKELFADQIIQAGIKEGIDKFKEEYIKKYQVNFNDTPRPNRTVPTTSNDVDEYFTKRAESRKNKNRRF